jgi:hypothetical protein
MHSEKVAIAFSGSAMFVKLRCLRFSSMFRFHWVQLSSFSFHDAGRLIRRVALLLSVMMRNRWSLPVYGPVVKISETVMVSEVMFKSIVEAFWEVGLMRVQKFGVVIRQALGSLIKASLMDCPT